MSHQGQNKSEKKIINLKPKGSSKIMVSKSMFTVSKSVQTIIDCNTAKVQYNKNVHVSILFYY